MDDFERRFGVRVCTRLGQTETGISLATSVDHGPPAHLEPRVPGFMLPRYVRVVDDLPRTETSMRVRKRQLRAKGVTADTGERRDG